VRRLKNTGIMLFKNPEIEKQYLQDGCVVLPLLHEKELTQLSALFDRNYKLQMQGLQPLLRVGSANKNIELHHEIAEILTPVLQEWFHSFAFNANHFIVKGANDPNEFRLHQDWNVVDETQFIAAHIWIALQDTDKENGGLFVVKGSHKFFDNYRSGSCGIAFIDQTEIAKPHITTIKLKRGEAIVYQQSLFHGSYPNTTNQPRLTCLCSIRALSAPMLYYHCDKEGLSSYEISPEILFEQIDVLEKGGPPKTDKKPFYPSPQALDTKAIDNRIFEAKL
jgi:hypothetical protein